MVHLKISLPAALPRRFLRRCVYLTAKSISPELPIIKNHELWVSDGTAGRTSLFVDVLGSGTGDPFKFVAGSSVFYFFAKDDTGSIVLWSSDGSVGGTTLVSATPVAANAAEIQETVVINDVLYFTKLVNDKYSTPRHHRTVT